MNLWQLSIFNFAITTVAMLWTHLGKNNNNRKKVSFQHAITTKFDLFIQTVHMTTNNNNKIKSKTTI